jgi:hypothetical protein
MVRLTLYAEKAPGKTVQYPNRLSIGLSRMLDILYSKHWAATDGVNYSPI